MPLVFYPPLDDIQQEEKPEEKIAILMEAAEQYKAAILEIVKKGTGDVKKQQTPREQLVAYNWEEIAKVLRQIRESPEITKEDKLKKANFLAKLAEVYEVLRAAKMAKLEAVRLALINEASQLRTGAQVAS